MRCSPEALPEFLLRRAAARLPDAIELLRRLVAVNSFTTNASGVDAVAGITAEAFASLGFHPESIASAARGSGNHLFLTRTGSGGGCPVVLVTHSDTVFPAEEEIRNNFHWDERPEEGRIYGPGTIDNKGGTALIWLTLSLLQENAPDFFAKTSWLVAANAAEEVTGDDFAGAVTALCAGKARAVLVFEGGPVDEQGWHLVTSRKGRSTWKLTAAGRASHAGSNHAGGVNAIEALVRVLPDIAAQTDRSEGVTVNIGSFHGGTVVNRVPHEAFAEWECRAVDPGALQKADAFFATLSATTEAGAVLTSTRTGHTAAWPGGEAAASLYRRWEEAAAMIGLTTVPVARGGLSDANHLSHLGPTLDGLGPSGANDHCSERSPDGGRLPEYLETESLVPKAVMNALALLSLDE
jgi:glutamate carboxypeptidase